MSCVTIRDITVNAMNNLLRCRDEHHMLPLLLIASIVVLLACIPPCEASQASDAFHKAQKLEKSGKVIEAYLGKEEVS